MNQLEKLLIAAIYADGKPNVTLVPETSKPQPYKIYTDYFQPDASNGVTSEFEKFSKKLLGFLPKNEYGVIIQSKTNREILGIIKYFNDNNKLNDIAAAERKLNQFVSEFRGADLTLSDAFITAYPNPTRPSIAKTASTSSFRTGGPTTPSTGASIQRPIVETKPGKQLDDIFKNVPPEDIVIEYEKIYIRSLKDAWKSFLLHDTDLQISGRDVEAKAATVSHNFIQKAKKINSYDYDKDPKAFSKFQNDSDRKDLVEFISDYAYKQLGNEICDFNGAKCNLYKTEIYAKTGEHLLTFETIDQDDKWVKAQYTIGKYADEFYDLTSSPDKFEQRLLIMQFIAEQTVKINKRLSIDNKDITVPSFFITAEGDNIDDRIIVAYFLMMHKCVIPVFGDQTEAFKARILELEKKASSKQLTQNEETILNFAKYINRYKNEVGGDTLFNDKSNPATIKKCLETNSFLIHDIYDPLVNGDSLEDDSKRIIKEALQRYDRTKNDNIDAYPQLSQSYDGKQSKIVIQGEDIPGKVIERVDPSVEPKVTYKPKDGKSKKLW